MLENTDRSIKKEDPVKLATFGTEDTRWRQEQKLQKIKKNKKKPTPYVLEITNMQTSTKPMPDFTIGLVC